MSAPPSPAPSEPEIIEPPENTLPDSLFLSIVEAETPDRYGRDHVLIWVELPVLRYGLFPLFKNGTKEIASKLAEEVRSDPTVVISYEHKDRLQKLKPLLPHSFRDYAMLRPSRDSPSARLFSTLHTLARFLTARPGWHNALRRTRMALNRPTSGSMPDHLIRASVAVRKAAEVLERQTAEDILVTLGKVTSSPGDLLWCTCLITSFQLTPKCHHQHRPADSSPPVLAIDSPPRHRLRPPRLR